MCYTRIQTGILLKIKKNVLHKNKTGILVKKKQTIFLYLVKDNTVCYIKTICKLFKITDVLYKNKTWYLVRDKKNVY